MVGSRSIRLVIPRPIRELPIDLAATIAMVALTNVFAFTPVIRETPLRMVFGTAFVLFVPGYAFVSALYPKGGRSIDESETADETFVSAPFRAGMGATERIALSLAVSVSTVSLVGMTLNYTPFGIRLVPILASLSGVTLVATVVAIVRRRSLSPNERFRIPFWRWVAVIRYEVMRPISRGDAAVNALLVAALLFTAAIAGFAITVPPEGDRHSGVYVLSENKNGEQVAEGFRTEFKLGESEEFIVGIDNNERRTVEYTVVAVEQALEAVDGETMVVDQREFHRFETRLGHGETWRHAHEIEPTIRSDDVRLAWLLYVDGAPESPTIENAVNRAQLRVTVISDADTE